MKKLLSLAVMGIMLVSGATMVFADESDTMHKVHKSGKIKPYALVCDCGGELIQKTSYTAWGIVGQVPCEKVIGLADVTWKREKVVKTTCSKCNRNRTDLYPESTTRCGATRPKD